jgi:hypothetical protein
MKAWYCAKRDQVVRRTVCEACGSLTRNVEVTHELRYKSQDAQSLQEAITLGRAFRTAVTKRVTSSCPDLYQKVIFTSAGSVDSDRKLGEMKPAEYLDSEITRQFKKPVPVLQGEYQI